MPFWLLATGNRYLLLRLLRYRYLRGLVDLRHRLALRRHRFAHDDVGPGRAWDRTAQEQQVVVGVHANDFQVAGRHAIPAHAARGTHTLHDARGKRRGADRTGRPMEHRAVRRSAAAEVMPLDDALEAMAAADSDHVDALAVLEHAADQDLVGGVFKD